MEERGPSEGELEREGGEEEKRREGEGSGVRGHLTLLNKHRLLY